jgi:hypothetical protein
MGKAMALTGRRKERFTEDGLHLVEWNVVCSLVSATRALDPDEFARQSSLAARAKVEPRPFVLYVYLDLVIGFVLKDNLGESPDSNEIINIARALTSSWKVLVRTETIELEDILLAAADFVIEGPVPRAWMVGLMAVALGILLREWHVDLEPYRPKLAHWVRENKDIFVTVEAADFTNSRPAG